MIFRRSRIRFYLIFKDMSAVLDTSILLDNLDDVGYYSRRSDECCEQQWKRAD